LSVKQCGSESTQKILRSCPGGDGILIPTQYDDDDDDDDNDRSGERLVLPPKMDISLLLIGIIFVEAYRLLV
jgi:hypothetical protein